MISFVRTTALACLGGVVLLSGCTQQDAPDRASEPVRPTATSTAAPDAAVRLAEHYHRSGGIEDVRGIRRDPGPDSVPLLSVWTRDPDSDAKAFEELKGSVVGYLAREEGLSLDRGYLMDVYGPDGGLRHRLDARP